MDFTGRGIFKTLFATPGIVANPDELQLNRELLTARIRLEMRLRKTTVDFFTFTLLLLAFIANLLIFDDIPMLGQIHEVLRNFYGTENVDNLHDPDEIMDYVQTFITQSYKIASALIDANTLDSIDVARCFSEDIADVCRLRYWSIPSYNSSAPNFVDLNTLLADTLSPFNVNLSVMDCTHPDPKWNCINRSDDKFMNINLTRPTFGLLPEQPVVLDSRLRVPLASIVALTPVVWQTRSPRVLCGGLGDLYNTKLRRGANTAFASSRVAPHTGRKQTIFLSYAEDTFICVDRSKLINSAFFDRSWHPWATYDEMHVGKPITSVLFAGKPVYYKFVSDVSYIQAPAPGAVRLTRDPCRDGPRCQTLSRDHVACVDPLQAGPDHPVWSDSPNLTYTNCSARSVWDSMYLNIGRESRSKTRLNTFFTIETSELNVASLVLTSQMGGIQNVVTLVRVTFNVEQSGWIEGKVHIESTSNRMETWYASCAIVLFAALLYLVIQWRKPFRAQVSSADFWKRMYDTLLCLGCGALIISNIIFDQTLSKVSDNLVGAFTSNSQEEYFRTFSSIAINSDRLQVNRICGFVLIALLFARLCLYASLHPRLAVLVDTLVRSSDELIHFAIYLGFTQSFLAMFAFWAFGQRMVEYSSLYGIFWSQFCMFAGDFSLATEEPDVLYMLYVFTYVFIIFILMLSFLLAIVVDAYMKVQQSVKADKCESSIVADLADIFKTLLLSYLRRWPSVDEVWRYFSTSGLGTSDSVSSLPAVTAEELLANVTRHDGKYAFRSLDDSRAYCYWYAHKVKEEGEYALLEVKSDCLFPPGQFFDSRNVVAHNVTVKERRDDTCRSQRSQHTSIWGRATPKHSEVSTPRFVSTHSCSNRSDADPKNEEDAL